MWVFTVDGFFSAVENRDDKAGVVVRGRTSADIVRLSERVGVPVVKSPKGSDYPYRVFCSKEKWAEYLNTVALGIDYDNFKSGMVQSKRFGWDRIERLHRVWEVMNEKLADYWWYGKD